MRTSHCTLALIAVCLIKGSMATNDHDVLVPRSVFALQGSSVIFNCSFKYPYSYIHPTHITARWLKYPCEPHSVELYSNEITNNRPEVRFIGKLDQKNCSLQISDIEKKHSDCYCFRFELRYGSRWTGKPCLNLTVYDRPTKPTLSFSTGLVEGVRTSLMCSSSNVDPRVKASLNWYGIADLAAQQPKADGSTATLNSNFEFIPSYQDHNKIVKCSVNYSSYSYSDEANITLQVKYAPKNITVQVDDGSQLEIKEGDKVSLMCASNSHPEATYTWYKRKGNTSQTKSINTMRGTLLFQNISRRDSGFYNCTATNYLGSETSEALEIRVQYKPVEVNISQAGMSFTCIAEASPLAQITWNYTGNVKTVINGIWTISTLTLQTTSSVCVSCQAQNEHGSVRSVKQCFRSTQISASVLLQAITGSIVGAVLLIAIVLWMRRKHLFRGKNSESDSQPVFHNEVQDPQEDNRTSTSIADNTYDNVCMHMSPGEKLDAPRKDSEGAIVYASIQFDNKPKDLKPARYNSEQTIYNNTQGNQATTLTDSAEYENLEKYKNISKEAGPTKKDSEETILYANTKFTDNQKDPKPAKHKAQQTVYGVIRGK